jgi:hypothetical protein
MRLRAILPLCLLVSSAVAQQSSGTSTPPPYAALVEPAATPQPANFSQELANLTDQPATHFGYTFDRNSLQAAQSVLEQQGMDAKRAAAALKGIAFDTYRYKQPAFYTPEAMAALLDSYKAAGWKHLVNANQTPASSAQPTHTITDMWLHFSGADVDGVTVLTRSSKTMNVVQVICDLRPLDLLHLGGHFGIPKLDPSAVMVPAPQGRE